jgi:WD40 repeat protein
MHGPLLSPDRKTTASAGTEDGVRLCDAATGKEIRRLGRAKETFWTVAFSPDGKLLSGHRPGFKEKHSIVLWEVATGKELYRFPVATNWRAGISFSPDSRTLAVHAITAFTEPCGSIYLWDVTTGKSLHHIQVAKFDIHEIAFTADCKLLASAGDKDEIVRLWDVKTGTETRRLKAHPGGVISVVFSPDGRVLASGGTVDGAVRLWETTTGKEFCKLAVHKKGPGSIIFSPDGKLLAAGGREDPVVRLWEVSTGKERCRLAGHFGHVAALAFSPDGKALASGGSDHTIRLWDVATGRALIPLAGQPGEVDYVAISPDGQTLATLGDDHAIRLWEAVPGKELRRIDRPPAYGGLTFSADGKTVISTSTKKTVAAWEARTGTKLREFQVSQDRVWSVRFSPDAKLLVARDSGEGPVDVRDVATGKLVRRLNGKHLAVFAFSPDNALLACSGDFFNEPTLIHLKHIASGQELRKFGEESLKYFPSNFLRVNRLTFSPDGRMLAGVSTWGNYYDPIGHSAIRFWEVASGKQRLQFKNIDGAIGAIAFSPDGRLLALGGGVPAGSNPGDDTHPEAILGLWDVATGKELRQLPGHRGRVSHVAFSADGRRLASASADGTVLIWDVAPLGTQVRGKDSDLPAQQLDTLWTDLASADAARAYCALQGLMRAPRQFVPLCKKQVRPVALADPKHVTQLLADLDSEHFDVRDRATRALQAFEEQVEPALRKASMNPPSAEVRRRLAQLLGRLESERQIPSGERLRLLRAVEILEHSASSEARQLVTALAKGAPEARLTQEAKAALERLKRPAAAPTTP